MQKMKSCDATISLKTQEKKSIRQLWHHLTGEEIDANEERHAEFFIAVRKKHGLPGAEAALILKDIHDRAF